MTTRKNVLITGASRGIGRAIALTLAAQGFGIIACASKVSTPFQEVCELLKSNGSLVDALTFDVADEAAARSSIEKTIEVHGAPWGVVSNAGITADAAFPALTSEQWRKVIRRFKWLFQCCSTLCNAND